jgi:hypothetical protein
MLNPNFRYSASEIDVSIREVNEREYFHQQLAAGNMKVKKLPGSLLEIIYLTCDIEDTIRNPFILRPRRRGFMLLQVLLRSRAPKKFLFYKSILFRVARG